MLNITVNKLSITYYFVGTIVLLLTTIGCNRSIDNYKEYVQYIGAEENGVNKIRTSSGLKIGVKYLPKDYLVYREFQNTKEEASKEKLEQDYENSLTFMLTFSPDEGKSFDVTRVGISNYEEFAERIETMNFNFSQFIALETEETEVVPELTQMESIYGLENKRNIILVFNKKEIKDDIKIVYKDELFRTGTHKFLFKKADLLAVPKFVF